MVHRVLQVFLDYWRLQAAAMAQALPELLLVDKADQGVAAEMVALAALEQLAKEILVAAATLKVVAVVALAEQVVDLAH
jgi:hypothetical protein